MLGAPPRRKMLCQELFFFFFCHVSLKSWCGSAFTTAYPAGAMTHKYHELSIKGQSWSTYPTTQVRGEGRFSNAMQVNEKCYVFDMQAYYKSETWCVMCGKNLKVKWAEPASRGRRSFKVSCCYDTRQARHWFQTRWSRCVFYLGKGALITITSWVSIYSSVIPLVLHKGEGVRGSANLNQCPLIDSATSLQLFIFFFLFFLQNFTRGFSLRKPLDSFLHIIRVSSEPDVWLSSPPCLASYTPLSLRSWFTTGGVSLSSTPQILFFQSAQTDRNWIYHTWKLSESQT